MPKHWLQNEKINVGKTLNMDRLIELNDFFPDNEESILVSLLSEFLKIAPACRAEFHILFAVAKFKDIRKAAHSLKSSSGNVGALNLSRLCQELEDLTEKETPTASVVAEMIGRIDAELTLVEYDLELVQKAAVMRSADQ